jgi:hypothetical protein
MTGLTVAIVNLTKAESAIAQRLLVGVGIHWWNKRPIAQPVAAISYVRVNHGEIMSLGAYPRTLEEMNPEITTLTLKQLQEVVGDV